VLVLNNVYVTGDVVRAARLRRESYLVTMRRTGDADPLKDLPLETFDSARFLEEVDGSNCENVIGFVPLPVGLVGPLLLDGKQVIIETRNYHMIGLYFTIQEWIRVP